MPDPPGAAPAPAFETVVAERRVPGVATMVGYRGLDLPETIHRGLPSASLTFILSLDDGVEAATTVSALARARPNPVVLSGLHLAASVVQQRRHQAGVQLAIHPLAARSLLGVPAADLISLEQHGYDGTAALGRDVQRLQDRLTQTGTWSQRFGLITDHLARHRREAGVSPVLVEAWRRLSLSRGTLGIAQLAGSLQVSERHLSNLFRREVGRSPKVVARLLRFEAVIAAVVSGVRTGHLDLAAVAARTGFADQAHLSREFRRCTGLTPTAWVAAEFWNVQDGAFRSREDSSHDTDTDESSGTADPRPLAHAAGA